MFTIIFLFFLSSSQIILASGEPELDITDADLAEKLDDFKVIDVPSILPGHMQDPLKRELVKKTRIAVPDVFDPREYAQGGGDGACLFLSTLANIMYQEGGRKRLKSLIIGQDKDAVYVHFPAPHINLEEFEDASPFKKFYGDLSHELYRIPRVFVKRSGSYPAQTPPWLYFIERAYHDLITRHIELFPHIDKSTASNFREMPLSTIIETSDLKEKTFERRFNILTGIEMVGLSRSSYDLLGMARNVSWERAEEDESGRVLDHLGGKLREFKNGELRFEKRKPDGTIEEWEDTVLRKEVDLKALLLGSNIIRFGSYHHSIALLARDSEIKFYNNLAPILGACSRFGIPSSLTEENLIRLIFDETASRSGHPKAGFEFFLETL